MESQKIQGVEDVPETMTDITPEEIEYLLQEKDKPDDINTRYYNYDRTSLIRHIKEVSKYKPGSKFKKDPTLYVLYGLKHQLGNLDEFVDEISKILELTKVGRGYYKCQKCKWVGQKLEMVLLEDQLIVGCPICNQ